jgi:hypothetical protein
MFLISSFEIPRYFLVMKVEEWFNIEDNLMRYSSEQPFESQTYLDPLLRREWVEIFLYFK